MLTMVRKSPSPGGDTMSCRHAPHRLAALSASEITRPCSLPTGVSFTPMIRASVGAMSALLTGVALTKPALNAGPLAAMKFAVSARLKLP